MRVAVMGFGSVWRHRLGKRDASDRPTGAVYYNTTGITVNGQIRQRPQICGYARFDTIGGFDPNHLSRMMGRVFECADPSVWMGYNRLLFRRILSRGEPPDCFLVVTKSEFVGQLLVGKQDLRSPGTRLLSLSESVGQQEALLLMSFGDWIRSSLGHLVPGPSTIGRPLACLVPRVPE
jgi:hypothetical protein